jgi:hypothetical protein
MQKEQKKRSPSSVNEAEPHPVAAVILNLEQVVEWVDK